MSDALVPVITRRGLAALVNAAANGLMATIDTMAIGFGANSAGQYVGYVPSKDATALANEIVRVPLLSGSRLDPVGFRVLAQVPSSTPPDEFAIREVGFYLASGELFMLWSDPDFPVASKTPLSDVDLAFDLFLEQIPTASLTINVVGPDVPDTAGVLAQLLATDANLFIAALDQERRLVSAKL